MKKKFIKKISVLFICTIFLLALFFINRVFIAFAEERTPLRVEDATKTISMDFKDASLKDVLKAFSQQSGLNFVASEKVKDKKITLYFDKVRVQDALNRILNAYNLTYEYTKESDIFIVKPTGIEEVKTVTRIYSLNYATVGKTESGKEGKSSSIESIIKKMLTKHGSIMSDKRTNSLIIRDIPAQFPLIERTIAKLDSRTPQVMIEAEILETTIDLASRLGVGIKHEGKKGRIESIPFYEADEGDFTPTTITTPSDSTFLGVISYSEFKGILDMLEEKGKVKYLARPRVLSLNNQTANINIATWASIGTEVEQTVEGRIIEQSAEREWVGTKLKVTPTINREGFITMEIEPEVSRTFPSKLSADFLDIFKKSAKTNVMVKDGETVVIGGLTKGEETKRRRKVPFLGDIPILGWLFKSRKASEEKSELVIFITPHIIKKGVYEEIGVAKGRKIMREISEGVEETLELEPELKEQEKEEEIKLEEEEKKRTREEEIDWVLNQMSQE